MGKVPRRKRLSCRKSRTVAKQVFASSCEAVSGNCRPIETSIPDSLSKVGGAHSFSYNVSKTADINIETNNVSQSSPLPAPHVGFEAVCFLAGVHHSNNASTEDPDFQLPHPASQDGDHRVDTVVEIQRATVVSCIDLLPNDNSNILLQVREKVIPFLNHRWNAIVLRDVLHVMMVPCDKNLSVQRNLCFSPDGSVELFVHNHLVNVETFLKDVIPPLHLHKDSINYFVDRVVSIVNNVKGMEICGGYDDEKFRPVWSSCPQGKVDENTFHECRYAETFRSIACSLLVNQYKWRCTECSKLSGFLRRRAKSASVERPHVKTANKNLSEEQKLGKLVEQRRQLDNATKKIARLEARIQQLIKKEGVQIEKNLANDFTEILSDTEITPAQRIFLQQQVKASQKKSMLGMRWHPTMIRLALSVYITSPSVYELLNQTGMLKLPSSRTLFDYARVTTAKEGIDTEVLNFLAKHVDKFKDNGETHKKYHVLMVDEMYISQNLIFQKSTGRIVGFTSLDYIDREVRDFEHALDNPQEEPEEIIASKVLVYMVKGVTNGLKKVIATYAVNTPSVNQFYMWTWQVIGALERSGIAVIALICDGFSVNRSLIKKHKPATVTTSGVIFDTWNKAARDRKLYFISDLAHLLKTIRNCLYNSRLGKNAKRRMRKNGKYIVWDYIIKLYKSKAGKNLRKSYKLNAMNVFPDSYARMKVKYAAQVLSKTVALDLMQWQSASELVSFILQVNDWFDCMNGAHTSVSTKTRNVNLAPYTSTDDPRFASLSAFLDYLNEWKNDAASLNNTTRTNVVEGLSVDNVIDELESSDVDEGGVIEEDETPTSQRLLSKQTLEGIEMTTRAFEPMVKFLLNEGASFINARVFSQDPLEQRFSRVRAGQGGSTNPNLGQVLNRNQVLDTVAEVGFKKRKGNSAEYSTSVQVSSEPLPKRKCNRTPKFLAET